MKKFFLTLFTVVMAVAMSSAADLYLRGDITGSNWPALPLYKFQTTDNNTYTLNVDELHGEFKIADASWGTHNYGGNGTKAELDKPYTCVSGGANISLAGSGKATNVTLTFVLSTKTLTIKGQASENNYDKLYIIGDINGSGWEGDRTDHPMEKVNGNDARFSGTLSVTSQSYVKFKAGTWTYGPGASVGEDVPMADGYTGTIYFPGGDKSYVLQPGNYTFTIDLTKGAESGTVTVSGQASLPTTLYLLGDYMIGNAQCHWDPTQGLAMTKTAEGVFRIDEVNVIYGADAAPSGYFNFCTQLDETGGWNVGQRYGATAKDETMAIGDVKPITSAADPMSFAVAPGAYKITVDFNTMTCTLDKAEYVTTVGIDDQQVVNVYNTLGMELLHGVKAADALSSLPAGMYIIGGRKVILVK